MAAEDFRDFGRAIFKEGFSNGSVRQGKGINKELAFFIIHIYSRLKKLVDKVYHLLQKQIQ